MNIRKLILLGLLAAMGTVTFLQSAAPARSAAPLLGPTYTMFLPLVARPPGPGSDAVTGLLVNTGTVATPRGVVLGALAASLASPITITIANTSSVGLTLP